MNMDIKIGKISGIQSESISLSEGLNVIQAPNAIGKTSIVNALKITTLPDKELKLHPEFLNDSANDGFVAVEFEKIKDDRKIRRYGKELAVVGNPLFNSNGKSELLFADPDNEIIHETIKGNSIEPFIERFSNVAEYKKLNSEVVEDTIDKLKAFYDEDAEAVSKIKSTEKEIGNVTAEREKLLNERKKVNVLYEREKTQIKDSGKIEILNKSKNELLEDVARLKQGLKSKAKELPLLESELKDNEKTRTEYNKNKSKVEAEQEGLAKEIGRYEAIQEDLQNDINKLDDNLDILDKIDKNTDWVKTKNCFVCGRPITSSVKNAWQKHLETERKKVNADLLKTENKLKEMNNRSEDIQDELNNINEINDTINKTNLRIAELESGIKSDTKDIEAKEKAVEKFKEDIKNLEKQINPETLKILRQKGTLDENIGEMNGKLKDLEENLKEFSEQEKTAIVLKRKIEFMSQVKEFIKRKIIEMKDGVKNKFNLRIKEVYSVLDFKNFDSVSINDSYRIEVVRKGKQQELNRLSTSERVTLGVVVMLAGKEEYLPDFPFFVLDEVTTAYDPLRFKKIIDYIVQKTKTKYVVVTAFSPTGDKIKIQRSI
jgi:chromosome segregation ATPase